MAGDTRTQPQVFDVKTLERTEVQKEPQVSQWEQAGSIRGSERPRLNKDGRAEYVLRTRPTDY
jgi:hypothetical protein